MRLLLILLIFIPMFAYADVERIMNDPCFMMEEAKGPCSYVVGNETYFVHTNGIIEFNSRENNKVEVDLPDHFEIEAIKHVQIDKDIVFNFGITDFESGSTLIARFSPEKSAILWQTNLYAFNSSPSLFDGNSLYVGGIGVVAKLNAVTGKVIWSHSGLYEKDTQAYNGFVLPEKDGELVTFKENKVSFAKYQGIRKVIVNDVTGEIVSK